MPRRVSLPGAAELFRTTQEPVADHPPEVERPVETTRTAERAPGSSEPATEGGRTRGSGRVRHDEKITVYVSGDELLALERARLVLRAEHGLAVDRGRIVREALALALENLDADGAGAALVWRLTSS
ncbi:MAG: hypothetical protein ACR2LI_14335 [Propionibacteriaceae bacterium]